MGAVVEVAYFNTYLLRNVNQGQVEDDSSGNPTPVAPEDPDTGYKLGGTWPSVNYFHLGYPKFPFTAFGFQE